MDFCNNLEMLAKSADLCVDVAFSFEKPHLLANIRNAKNARPDTPSCGIKWCYLAHFEFLSFMPTDSCCSFAFPIITLLFCQYQEAACWERALLFCLHGCSLFGVESQMLALSSVCM